MPLVNQCEAEQREGDHDGQQHARRFLFLEVRQRHLAEKTPLRTNGIPVDSGSPACLVPASPRPSPEDTVAAESASPGAGSSAVAGEEEEAEDEGEDLRPPPQVDEHREVGDGRDAVVEVRRVDPPPRRVVEIVV